jgi:hypothetical protein
MPEDVAGTKYVVLREISIGEIGDESDVVLSPGARLFITDEKVYDAPSGERACRDGAEEAKLGGVWASVPQRSWDPAEYELVEKVEARRVRS